MKLIENKTTEITTGLKTESGEPIMNNYGTLIEYALNMRELRLTTGQMKTEFAIFDAIAKQRKENIENSEAINIELEDAQFDYLKSIISNYIWNFRHKDILTFTDYINDIK